MSRIVNRSRIVHYRWVVEAPDAEGVPHLYGPFHGVNKADAFANIYKGKVIRLRHPDDVSYDQRPEGQ
jgi:hypothetical protein